MPIPEPVKFISSLTTNEVTVICTKGITDHMQASRPFEHEVSRMLARFENGDWGDLDENDNIMNNQNAEQIALGNGGSVLASYKSSFSIPPSGRSKVWLKQDVFYGSDEDYEIGKLTNHLTVLFPSEY